MNRDALRATFFEECEDLLSSLAEGLGLLARADSQPDTPTDIETLHSVFRAVHSIKGGAGAFGLTGLVEFAHTFETVLDRMRSGKMSVRTSEIKVLLRAFDVLSDMIAVARDGGEDPPQAAALLLELDLLAEAGGQAEDDSQAIEFQPLALDFGDLCAPEASPADPEETYRITLAPTGALYDAGHEPAALLLDLARLGSLETVAEGATVAPLAEMDLSEPRLTWRMTLRTTASPEEIASIFEFVGDLANITVSRVEPAGPPLAKPVSADRETGTADPPQPKPPSAEILPIRAGTSRQGAGEAPHAVASATATIRVNLDRVDRLINQIGELVIMEAMLAQAVASAGLRDNGDVSSSLDGIKQLASSIQETVMSIRAQPLKPVFQRMERILREACDATGKDVRLITVGDTTEVDRTVIERLVDPLTHMIRNSVDHGIEAPQARARAGKPAQGVITLSAAHRSGRVIIEVKDDGAGIDRVRVRDVAEARGLVAPGTQLSPSEIDNLLFMPGFSSKEEVSAISGRGVGLDVVRREIQSLGGRVMIASVPGQGTTFTIALPLTLAVLEGMLIRVGQETMVLPLSAITETILPTPAQMHRLGSTGWVVANRDKLIPLINLAEFFGLHQEEATSPGVLIMVETEDGRQAALAVDGIQDQRQVVIKSLANNYGDVEGISAATILGDGRIALIIDPRELVERSTVDHSPQQLATYG